VACSSSGLHSLHPALKSSGYNFDFPGKRLFFRFNDDFLESRRAGLEAFLVKVLSSDAASLSSVVRFCLQKYLPHTGTCECCGLELDPVATRPVLSGYVHKQGQFNNKWQRRYFVLSGTHIAYYECQEAVGIDRPLGIIHLVNSTVAMKGAIGPPESPHTLSLQTPNRGFVISTTSEGGRARWVEVMVQAKHSAPKTSREVTG
jgi:hypothetical protein